MLARAVREVEAAVQRGRVTPVGAHQVPGRRAAGPRGAGPGQGRRGRAARPSAPSSSSASTASPRSWRRPPPATPRCSRCSPRTPWSPTRPRAQARDAARPPASSRRPRTSRARAEPAADLRRASAAVVPQSVVVAPAGQPVPRPRLLRRRADPRRPRRLAGWELLGPLFRSFEDAGGGASSCMALPEPTSAAGAGRPGADAAPGAGGRRRRGRAPHLPARRRARPGQDRPGAARRAGRRRLPAARRRARTSSRPTGPARPASGRRTARPP